MSEIEDRAGARDATLRQARKVIRRDLLFRGGHVVIEYLEKMLWASTGRLLTLLFRITRRIGRTV